MTDQALFSVEHLGISFRRHNQDPFIAVNDISFTIQKNEILAIVGESGSGKSITALSIIGLLPEQAAQIPKQSKIIYQKRNILTLPKKERRAIRGTDVAMVFQEPMSSLNPVMTVGNQVMEVLRYKRCLSDSEAYKCCIALFDETGLPDPEKMMRYFPNQLSGGQQQRIMIAMALACDPHLLIADEPTTALDVTIQKQIIALLKKIKMKRHMSILFISHDLALVGELADRIIVMRHGTIREQGNVKQIFLAPQDAYTRALLKCRPAIGDMPSRHLPVIEDYLSAGQTLPHNEAIPENVTTEQNKKPASIILKAEHIKKSFFKREGFFHQREIPAVKDTSFILRRKKTLGIVGESGSGKTTLAMTVLRLQKASGGNIYFDDQEILSLSDGAFLPYRRRMQIVFQNPYASLNPRFTIGQSLMEPILLHGMAANRKSAIQVALEWLARVGLVPNDFYKFPHEFSGGQRQRIALARALTVRPELLILDEPVSALDVSVQAQILNLLKDIQDQFGISYLFISHDLAVVHFLCDEVMVMHKGEVVEHSEKDELFRHPKTAYTQHLLASVPKGFVGHL